MKIVNIAKLRTQMGFTLLEVMVALGIIAMTAAAILSTSGNNAQLSQDLYKKTLAQWIAENRIATMRGINQFPAVGKEVNTEEFGHHEWEITTEVEETGNPSLRLIVVTIREDDDFSSSEKDATLFQLTGFLGQH